MRQELQAALRGRVPLDDIGRSVGVGVGFTHRVDAFAAELWRAENPQTGERRLIIPRFEARGNVLGNYGYYSSAADAVRKNWPELEAEIVGAAGRWFQENVAGRTAPPAARAGTPWTERSLRGILPAEAGRHLERLKAFRGSQSANDQGQEKPGDGQPAPAEELQFRTWEELAAWASGQAVAAERRR